MLRASVFRACLMAALIGLATPAAAQQPAPGTGGSPVLTLNQERLYQQSDFGKRVQAEIAKASRALQDENRRIQSELIAEEQRLTDERPTMDVTAFQELASDFDTRVVSIRAAQDDKADAIRQRAEAERARFFELAFPVLFSLVEETGAVAILNSASVIFSVRQIDITERAIARVNEQIGASPLPRDGPSPQQRPDGFGELDPETPETTTEATTEATPEIEPETELEADPETGTDNP